MLRNPELENPALRKDRSDGITSAVRKIPMNLQANVQFDRWQLCDSTSVAMEKINRCERRWIQSLFHLREKVTAAEPGQETKNSIRENPGIQDRAQKRHSTISFCHGGSFTARR